jgi:hypothetical protein
LPPIIYLVLTSTCTFIAAVVQVVVSQPVLLTSSVEQVCPGKSVTFTCTTTGSSTLIWRSEDYIGSGRFEFVSIDDNGTVRRSTFYLETIAILTAINTDDPGMPILTSILRTIARSTTSNISVSCINAGRETSTKIIPLAGK